jgi:hypothetical protein
VKVDSLKPAVQRVRVLFGVLLLLVLAACRPVEFSESAVVISKPTATPTSLAEMAPPAEVQIVELPLEGEAATSQAEYSGLAWYQDYLILLPQFPSGFENSLLAIPKAQILAFLDGEVVTLTPRKIPIVDADVKEGLKGFEGYEALAFNGEIAYLTIESDAGAKMACYVVRGEMAADLSVLTLEAATRKEIPHPVEIDNTCDEALLVYADQVVTFFEANGANINPNPAAHLFDAALDAEGTRPLPSIEYRITDVSAPNAAGRFWAVNYMYPGDAGKLMPAADPLAAEFGVGTSHAANETVERLIELEITDDAITLTDTAPIWLQLLPDESRNWEGLVRLDARGFLLVTDKFPETILAFVPYP